MQPTNSVSLLALYIRLRKQNVTLMQYLFLGNIPTEGATMGHMANVLDCTPASITGMVDRLEKTGHVRRSLDTDDRRKVLILITARGQRFLEGFHVQTQNVDGK